MKSAKQRVSQEGSNNNAVQIAGNNNCVYVGTGRTKLSLEPYSALAGRPIAQDIEILQPSREAVALVGRERELAEVREWLSGDGIRVTAIYGGGTGKTRFARELLKGLDKDWDGGFLSEKEARRFAALENLQEWSWKRPALVVVDYAESMREELKAWLNELGVHAAPSHALRILLLERHASEQSGWYKDLIDASEHGAAARALFFPIKPRELSKLAGFDDRLSVFGGWAEAAGGERLRDERQGAGRSGKA